MAYLFDSVATRSRSYRCGLRKWWTSRASVTLGRERSSNFQAALYRTLRRSIVQIVQVISNVSWPLASMKTSGHLLPLISCQSGYGCCFRQTNDRLINLDAYYTKWGDILALPHVLHKDLFTSMSMPTKSLLGRILHVLLTLICIHYVVYILSRCLCCIPVRWVVMMDIWDFV